MAAASPSQQDAPLAAELYDDDDDSRLMIADEEEEEEALDSSDSEEPVQSMSLVMPTAEEEEIAFKRGVEMLNDPESLLVQYCGHLPKNAVLTERQTREVERDYTAHGIAPLALEVDEKRTAREKKLKELVRAVHRELVDEYGEEEVGTSPPGVYYPYPAYYTSDLAKRPLPKPREVQKRARGPGVRHWCVTSRSVAADDAAAGPGDASGKKGRTKVHVVQYRVIDEAHKPDPENPGSSITTLNVYCKHMMSPNVCPTCNQNNNYMSTSPEARLLETAKVRRCPICDVNDGPCPHPMAVPSPVGPNMLPAGRLCIWRVSNLTVYKVVVCGLSNENKDNTYYCQHGEVSPRCKKCRRFFTALTKRCREGGPDTAPFLEKANHPGKRKKAAAASGAKASSRARKTKPPTSEPGAAHLENPTLFYAQGGDEGGGLEEEEVVSPSVSPSTDLENTIENSARYLWPSIEDEDEDEEEEEEDEEEEEEDNEEEEGENGDHEDCGDEEEESDEDATNDTEMVDAPGPSASQYTNSRDEPRSSRPTSIRQVEAFTAPPPRAAGVRLAGTKRAAPEPSPSVDTRNTQSAPLLMGMLGAIRSHEMIYLTRVMTAEEKQASKIRLMHIDQLHAEYAKMSY